MIIDPALFRSDQIKHQPVSIVYHPIKGHSIELTPLTRSDVEVTHNGKFKCYVSKIETTEDMKNLCDYFEKNGKKIFEHFYEIEKSIILSDEYFEIPETKFFHFKGLNYAVEVFRNKTGWNFLKHSDNEKNIMSTTKDFWGVYCLYMTYSFMSERGY